MARKQLPSIESISGKMEMCRQIERALRQTDQPVVGHGSMGRPLKPTEYERARGEVLADLRILIRQLTRVRLRELSPDAILAHSQVATLIQRCEKCPRINRQRIKAGKQFACLAQAELDGASRFRFNLNPEGQIIEVSA